MLDQNCLEALCMQHSQQGLRVEDGPVPSPLQQGEQENLGRAALPKALQGHDGAGKCTDEPFPGKWVCLVPGLCCTSRKELLSSAWCSAPGLGNARSWLHPSPAAGKQSHSSSPCRHSEEGRRWRSVVLAWAALPRVPGSRQPKTCLLLLSPPAAGAGRTTAAAAPSSCLSPPAQRAGSGKAGAAPSRAQPQGQRVDVSAGTQRCCIAPASSLRSLAGNAPAFPLRSALLWLCSLRSACTC